MKIAENKALWDGTHNWEHAGDEWSASFGGPAMQWYGSLLPRVHRFLPTGTVLEIACGFGRWTQFLRDRCNRLYAIDLAQACVDASSQRFASDRHVTCHLTDGKSLAMVPDKSVDFVFSFDSLVHADASVLEAYISQLPRILKKNGAAFIHHSNLGAYDRISLRLLGLVDEFRMRDPDVSSGKVEGYAVAAGMRCISQELHTWGTRWTLLDCMTTLVMPGNPLARENRKLRNRGLVRESDYLEMLAKLYS
ncbi:MAG: class I SAM-dependent methyltransferase [Acidobacteriota bacterium]|nr:class I SAM-dependent methyltransferase [Acidobacteriota bacterium]